MTKLNFNKIEDADNAVTVHLGDDVIGEIWKNDDREWMPVDPDGVEDEVFHETRKSASQWLADRWTDGNEDDTEDDTEDEADTEDAEDEVDNTKPFPVNDTYRRLANAAREGKVAVGLPVNARILIEPSDVVAEDITERVELPEPSEDTSVRLTMYEAERDPDCRVPGRIVFLHFGKPTGKAGSPDIATGAVWMGTSVHEPVWLDMSAAEGIDLPEDMPDLASTEQVGSVVAGH